MTAAAGRGLVALSTSEQVLEGDLGELLLRLHREEFAVDHVERLAVVEGVPRPHELRVWQLAGVRQVSIEVVAVDAGVEVDPAPLADLPLPRPPVAHPRRPALEALLQALLLFFSLSQADWPPALCPRARLTQIDAEGKTSATSREQATGVPRQPR